MKQTDLLTVLLKSHIAKTGTSIALRSRGKDCSYQQLGKLVCSLQTHLGNLGVLPGDRVLVQLPNSVEYVVAFFAILSLGAIVVPLDSKSGPQRLDFVTAETSPSLLILEDDLQTDNISKKISLRIDPPYESILVNSLPVQTAETKDLEYNLDSEQTAAIIFSSGSTGRPKGVMLKHRHLVVTARNLAALTQLTTKHRELLLSPICHTDGWQRVAATLLVGGCVVFFEGPLTVPHFVDFVVHNQIVGFYSPPPFVRYLLQSSPHTIEKIKDLCKTIEIGSAPVSPPELKTLMHLFPHSQIYVHFGLTESSRATAYNCRDNPSKLDSVGKALAGVEIKIVNKGGITMDPGTIGEIFLRGSQCTEAYWNQPKLSQESFENGWFKTGDYGSIDTEGFLTYHGRRDDMINFGGHHFFPNEVEIELGPIEGLQSYLVAGKLDADGVMGQIPIMFAIKKPDFPWSLEKFFSYARQRIAPFKIPRKIIFVPEIIRTSSGKPDRQKMLQAYSES